MSGSESELLDDLRPRAFAIAYRMLGSVSEAEDIVQEALVASTRRSSAARRSPHPAPTSGRSRRGWRSTSSARRGPAGRATSASGFRSRSPRARRTTRPLAPRRPTPCRSPFSFCSSRSLPSSAPRCCYTTSSTTATTRSRRSSGRARATPASSPPAPAGTSWRAGPGSSRRPSFESASPTASSLPPRTASSRRSRLCSPRTSSCTAMGAGSLPRSSVPPLAGSRSSRCFATGGGSRFASASSFAA